MNDTNKTIVRQCETDFNDYCHKQTDCERCKLYDEKFECDCKLAFAVLNGLGKIIIKYDDSEV